MNAIKTIVAAGATLALAAPAANASLERMLPAKAKVTHRIVDLGLRHRQTQPARRVIYIHIPGPATPQQQSEQEWQAQYDQDLIDHGLDPVYNVGAAS